MQPIRNQIIFKPDAPKEYSDNGLMIPDSCKTIPNRGTIISVGRGIAKQPMKLKEGTICHRVKDWGEPIVIDEELHFMMDANAIIAIE